MIRTQETNIANLTADLVKYLFTTDICILNSGSLRTDNIIPAGPFKYNDLLTMLPNIEPFIVIKITGAQLLVALENGVGSVPALEGKFPCISGIRVKYDSSKEPGQRIIRVKIGKELLNENKLYTCATTTFLKKGKDGYTVFKDCELVRDIENSLDFKTCFVDFLQDLVVRPELDSDYLPSYVYEALALVNNKQMKKCNDDPNGGTLRHEYYKIYAKVDGRLTDTNAKSV
jgi:5'-nucleotidase